MKSIPNLEMPPAVGPPPKGDASGDKLELSGEALPELGPVGCPLVLHVLVDRTNLSRLKNLVKL